MSSENRSYPIVAAAVLIVGTLVTVGLIIALGGGQKPPAADLDEVMALADQANSGAPAGEVRGAPMASSPEAVTLLEEGEPASSLLATPDGIERPKQISKESLDLLSKVDSGGDGADVFNFEKTKDGLFYKVSFKALGGFKYEVPDPEVVRAQPDPSKPPVNQVPEQLMQLNESPVLLAGFMVPIDLDASGKVRSFALTQDQMFCCYGVPPKMNEWVMVEMEEGHTAEYKLDAPVAVYGTLKVGEEIEDGYVLSLYRVHSDKVIDVRELLEQTRG